MDKPCVPGFLAPTLGSTLEVLGMEYGETVSNHSIHISCGVSPFPVLSRAHPRTDQHHDPVIENKLQ